MVATLGQLIAAESPSKDLEAVTKCASVVAESGERILGSDPERLEVEGRPHLSWRFGVPKVMLLGHFDTVWPIGSLQDWPTEKKDGIISGPGSFDMKAGIVQGLFAIAALEDKSGVHLLLTSDEEIGSPSSRKLIEDSAGEVQAVLVLEPSEKGALKVARMGVSGYQLQVDGLAAHAGIDPTKGINAVIELARQILAVEKIADPTVGTTVTPTVASAGTTANTVPARAEVHLDVRAPTIEEQTRVDKELRNLSASIEGATVTVSGGPNRPPLEREASAELFELAQQVGQELGMPLLEGVRVGGGSDGNLTAAVGVRTLDGLGAVGGGAHALSEHVVVDAMSERAALVAGLLERLLRDGS
jgi:glutamate carboxypeptidase